MNVIVIGSGLIGISTAWALRERGAEVTVLERAEGPARETSFANGALLTPSMADPWNSPGVFWRLLHWVGREDSPMLLRPRALPSLARWGLQFIRYSSRQHYRHNTLLNAQLAVYSLRALQELRQQVRLDYASGTLGTMRLFRERADLDAALEMVEWLAQHGVHSRTLDRDATLGMEPALEPIAGQLAGGIHYPDDEHGDAFRFCEDLARHATERGVRFHYATRVERLEARERRITRVVGESQSWEADAVVVAAGSYSPQLVANLGIRVPVQPVKGYSITVPLDGVRPAPRMPLLDDSLHAVAVPLADRMRLAGTAEFAGFDRTVTPARLENLRFFLRQTYPQIARTASGAGTTSWAGLRPMSCDGVPIIGATALENLFLNTGHGPLGWTMCVGSGRALADLMLGARPEIDLAPYSLQRFG
ncbi:MAG TPA: D-amino acid dehydrogenase [Steroidobacteraceae bacterium]|nr:D-amino acid dehydrogenase [Steroidobacteraceae bacterium]